MDGVRELIAAVSAVILLALLIIVSTPSYPVIYPAGGAASWCYQETANVSTACGGVTTGNYNYVGNPDFPWDMTFYINYTKPATANNSSLWQVKHGWATPGDGDVAIAPSAYNISIPTSCWSQTPLQLAIYTTGSETNFNSQPKCYNGTAWQNIGTYYYGSTCSNDDPEYTPYCVPVNPSWGGYSALYDGNWSTASIWMSEWTTTAYSRSGLIYEEAMWWEIEQDPFSCVFSPNVSSIKYRLVFNETTTNLSYVYPVNQSNPAGVYQCLNNGSSNLTVYISQNDTYNVSVSCYQETANVSTECGGLDDGGYQNLSDGDLYAGGAGYLYDGDWDTGYHSYNPSAPVCVDIIYKKPAGALSSSAWQVSDDGGTVNLTINSSCWSSNSTHIKLRGCSHTYGGYQFWQCHNSTSQITLRNSTGGFFHYVKEEAMWWNTTYDAVTTVASSDYFNNSSVVLGTSPSVMKILEAGQRINISLYRNYSQVFGLPGKSVSINISGE